MTNPKPPLLSDLAQRLDESTEGSASAPHDESADRPVLVLGGSHDSPLGTYNDQSDRRTFLARAGALSLAIPGLASALTACTTDTPAGRDSTGAAAGAG